MEKIQSFLLTASSKIFAILQVGVVILILLGFGKLVESVFPCEYQMSNILLAEICLLAIILLLIVISFFLKKVKFFLTAKRIKICCGIYATLIFLVQLFVCKSIYFVTLWDVSTIHSAADVLAKGGTIQNWIVSRGDEFAAGYFNAYPNNIFLTNIFAWIKKVALFFGCSDTYFPTIVVGLICIDLSILFIVLTVWKLSGNSKFTILCLVIATLFLGFNPWIAVPYSDTYALLFTSIIMYLYCAKREGTKGYLSWVGIVLSGVVGTYIKPTVAIALMAIIIIEILRINRTRLKEFAIKGVVLIGGTIIISSIIGMLSKSVYEERNSDGQMTLYHYMMMGLNDDTYGSYWGGDRVFSWSISDPDERKNAQMDVIKKRLQEKGMIGSIKFYLKKMIIANKDGTFAWKWEGGFFGQYRGMDSRIAKYLQKLYYAEDSKILYNVFQSIWITLQILVAVFALFCSSKKKKECFLAISLVGINLFLMLFEVRARYLLLYVPYYIVSAMLGLIYIKSTIENIHINGRLISKK